MRGRETGRVNRHVDRRLWHSGVWLMALALAVGSTLVTALALGWNTPRPPRPPDWQAPDLPLTLTAVPDAAAATLLNDPVADFTLEIEGVPLSGPDFSGYGLIYRAQDATRYYVLAVGGDGYYAVLRVDGGAETLLVDWRQFPHVRRGQQANRLRVACAGPSCRFYINDEYASTVEDDTWLAGAVGLWACSFGEEAVSVQFQRVRVWVEK